MDVSENNERNDLFSRSIRAGKRTYFFDVKSTKSNEYYLTMTESKKRFTDDGKFTYEKHKIFLYKEDFEKFMEALNEAVGYINANSPEVEPRVHHNHNNEHNGENSSSSSSKEFSDVNFEDLDK